MNDPTEPGRSYHDMGGLPAGKVEPTEHDYAEWERRVDAMMMLLTGVSGGERRMSVTNCARTSNRSARQPTTG